MHPGLAHLLAYDDQSLVPNASPDLAFTSLELRLLDQLVKEKKYQKSHTYPLSIYLIKLARLGGYLARTHDPPPGNMVIWRGLSRLTDIQLGFLLGAQLVGIESKTGRLHRFDMK